MFISAFIPVLIFLIFNSRGQEKLETLFVSMLIFAKIRNKFLHKTGFSTFSYITNSE